MRGSEKGDVTEPDGTLGEGTHIRKVELPIEGQHRQFINYIL